jgi:hypothetical protein
VRGQKISLQLSRARTDHSCLALRTEKSLSDPNIADEVIESNLLGEEGKCPANLRVEMKDTMMHHRQPRPTVRTRSFQRRCAKDGCARAKWECPSAQRDGSEWLHASKMGMSQRSARWQRMAAREQNGSDEGIGMPRREGRRGRDPRSREECQ